MATAVLNDLVARVRQRLAGDLLRDLGDDELLQRYRHGSQDAFTVLVERHAPLVLSVCKRMLGNGHDAEDAFQATFLVLARRAGSVRWEACIRGWLYRVALQVARRARLRAERQRQREQQAARDEATCDPTWQEGLARIDQELAALPDNYRDVLLACCVEGKSRDEAGAELGLSSNQVKGLLERARDLLRVRLARRGVALPAAALLLLLHQTSAQAAPPLVAATTQASLAFAAGEAQAIAPTVLTLTQGVLTTMSSLKSLWTAGLSLLVALAASLGAWASYESTAPLTTVASGEDAEAVALQEKKGGVVVPGIVVAVDAAKSTITLEVPPVKKEGAEKVPGEKLTLPVLGDATISINGKPGKLGDIKVGEKLLAKLTEDRKTVVGLLVGGDKGGDKGEKEAPAIRGILAAVDAAKNTVTIETAAIKKEGGEKVAGEKITLPVAADAKIAAAGKPANLTDLKVGQPVQARLAADKKSIIALLVGGESKEGKEGKKETPSVRGTLAAVDAAKNTLTLSVTMKTKTGEVTTEKTTYTVAVAARIVQNGQPVKLGDLKVGELVVVQLSEDKKNVTALNASPDKGEKKPGEEGKKGGEYVKVLLKTVDVEKRSITVTVPTQLGNVDKSLAVAKDAKITIDGKPGELKDVKAGTGAGIKLGAENAVAEILIGGGKQPEKK